MQNESTNTHLTTKRPRAKTPAGKSVTAQQQRGPAPSTVKVKKTVAPRKGGESSKKKKVTQKKYVDVEYDPEADVTLYRKRRKSDEEEWEDEEFYKYYTEIPRGQST